MKLSTRGRYAVMAMADLANKSRGRPIPLADIAQRQEISLSYLEQLFGKLRRGQQRWIWLVATFANFVTAPRSPRACP